MSISYFILCHESPLMVADLFRTLYNPRDTFLIHVDRKAPDALHRFVASLAGGFGNVYEVPTRYCSWGGFSLVDATLDAMAFALELRAGLAPFHSAQRAPPAAVFRRCDPGPVIGGGELVRSDSRGRDEPRRTAGCRAPLCPTLPRVTRCRQFRLRCTGSARKLVGPAAPWQPVDGPGPGGLRGVAALAR